MRIIIAGSRAIKDINLIEDAIKESGFDITELVCGMARGVDMLAYRYGKMKNIPIQEFPAKWYDLEEQPQAIRTDRRGQKYNLLAGHNRNKRMLDYVRPDGAVIAIWNGHSGGTKNMIEIAQKANIKTYIKRV